MASKSVYEDYSKVAATYDKYRVAFGIEIILGSLAKYGGHNPVSSLSILEAGCGTGNFTREMCRYVGQVTAVDGSDAMLAVAKDKLKGVTNVSFRNVDLRKQLPFDSQQFDGVHLVNVAHHLDEVAPDGHMRTENLQFLISEFCRVLKKGAPLIIVTSTVEQLSKCVWHHYFAIEKGYSEIVQLATKRFLTLDLLGNICVEKGFGNEKRIVPTSERFHGPEYFQKENVLSEEFRLGDSSWRNYQKSDKFSHLLAAFKEAIDKNEMDQFIDQSECLRGRLGDCTFLIFNKT